MECPSCGYVHDAPTAQCFSCGGWIPPRGEFDAAQTHAARREEEARPQDRQGETRRSRTEREAGGWQGGWDSAPPSQEEAKALRR